MKVTIVWIMAVLSALCGGTTAAAQLTAAKDNPIVYGHVHLNVKSVEVHKKFWVDTLGGTLVKFGTVPEFIKFPNFFVLPRQATPPTGGTKGTTVDHISFQVPSVRTMVEKVRAAGFPIVTRAELPASFDLREDIAFMPDLNTSIAFTMAPDYTKVEFVENKAMTLPIALHHIHYAAPNVAEMKAWYIKTFGASSGKREHSFEAADLPGLDGVLMFSAAAEKVVGTKGRTLDRIGFDVKGLEELCKKLESMGIKLDRPYNKNPALNVATAFLTDPWGTYIELTEGLDRLQ